MQVIEKVKVVPEGYNGAGMDGMYGRRDVNGKANAGLTLGIIGTALGAWALFGNRRSAGILGTGAGLMGDGSTNINVVGVGGGNGTAPTAFQAWAKSCEDTLALQGGLYQWALNQQNQRFQDRQVIDGEMFGLYKSQIDADFSLYKGQRDNYDALKTQIEELKTQVAVGAAIRPYQDKLIQCEIERAFTAGINYVDKKTCNVIYGDEHFNKQEAKQTVDEMYHVKDGKKYIGEKYDMQKAHEVCNKFKDKLEEDIEVADVYVAINAQYHDYCKLFEKWFGKGNFDDMIFESAIDFWFDDVDFGEDKLWKYFNELK